MYFSEFPLILLDNVLIRNFLIRIVNDFTFRRNDLIFTPHVIQDHERADTISTNFYDHPKFSWTIYIINNISPRDWPKTSLELDEYLDLHHGNTQYNVRHYVDSEGSQRQRIFAKRFTNAETGEVVEFYNDGEGYGALNNDFLIGTTLQPVTHRDYHTELNDKKRNIRLLDKEFINDFSNDFKNKMNNLR